MKIVILYSGGLDSFLLKRYAEEKYPGSRVKCLYYKHGGESEKWELKVLPSFVEVRKLQWLGKEIKAVCKKDDPFAGAIYIPGRNLVLSCLAACQELADEVWMGTVYDEDNYKGTDKNERFRSGTSKLLTYVLSPFKEKVIVRFPFVENKWTKVDCVRWALRNGVTKRDLCSTVSCWNQTKEFPCGSCKQCFKRALVFLLNGISQENVVNPLDSTYGRFLMIKYIDACKSGEKINRDEENVYDMIKKCFRKSLLSKDTMVYLKERYRSL